MLTLKSFFVACLTLMTLAVPNLCWGQSAEVIAEQFASPPSQYRPDTWFHVIGYNMSKEGLTKDLEAIHAAGLGGIQLFCRAGNEFPEVDPVVPLSPKWFELIGHASRECDRLGLSFTLQNCGGWAMTGGPWVPVEDAQRELVETTFHLREGSRFDSKLPLSKDLLKDDKNYQDVCVIAFPTPLGDDEPILVPSKIESNNKSVPWADIFNPEGTLYLSGKNSRGVMSKHKDREIKKVSGKDTFVQVQFDNPVTLRSLRIPSTAVFASESKVATDVSIMLETVENGTFKVITTLKVPDGCWMDKQHDITLAVPEVTTKELRITFLGKGEPFLGRLFLQSRPRTHNWEAKAALALRELMQNHLSDYQPQCYIQPDQILDLSDRFTSGKLDWTPPKGAWTIIRIGHVNMEVVNGPSPKELQGWETNKLDKEPLDHHLRQGMIGQLLNTPGSVGKDQLDGLLADSWERMIPTWTVKSQGMFDEFKRRRGYDLRPFLPAVMGYVVADPLETEKFLRDWRQTMDDLYVENFFGHFTTLSNEVGAKSSIEGATGEVLPGDALRYYGVADIPMTEFWYRNATPDNDDLNYKPVKYAASAAHIYNKPVVAAEALTEGGSNWKEDLFCVKPLIDQHFALGVNHLVFHTFTHNPNDVYPGSTFGGTTGFPFVRHQTWWRHMPAFTDYLRRCQYVLQQGEYAADVLWYLGDELERPPYQMSPFPDGYQYDLINAEVLQNAVGLEQGSLKIQDGGRYRILWLRGSQRMLRSTAEKIKELVMAGAIVLGDKPTASPSLMDSSNDVNAMQAIADELWGHQPSGVKQVGKGKVYWGQTIAEVLKAEAVLPDLMAPKTLSAFWHHRTTPDADYYFISSQNANAINACLTFRDMHKLPELWDPMTGKQITAPVWKVDGQQTHVAIPFDPYGSVIVVFQKPMPATSITKIGKGSQIVLTSQPGWSQPHQPDGLSLMNLESSHFSFPNSGVYQLAMSEGAVKTVTAEVTSKQLDGLWQVSFEKGWDTPASIQLDTLQPLTNHPDKSIQYYSGTTTYRKKVSLDKASIDRSEKMLLDLGTVGDIAEVFCNGESMGTRWASPFVFDLSKAAHAGVNDIEIRVTNTWRNQLVYDTGRSKVDKKTWTSNPPNNNKEKPIPFGLVGPVVLKTTQHEDLP